METTTTTTFDSEAALPRCEDCSHRASYAVGSRYLCHVHMVRAERTGLEVVPLDIRVAAEEYDAPPAPSGHAVVNGPAASDDLISGVVDACAQAGMVPADADERPWIEERYFAVRDAGNRLVLARLDVADERIFLSVTTPTGVVLVDAVGFPLGPIGLDMFAAAASAA